MTTCSPSQSSAAQGGGGAARRPPPSAAHRPPPCCRYERFQFHFLPYTGGASAPGASNFEAPAWVVVRANTTVNVSGDGAGCWGRGGAYGAPLTPGPAAWGGVWPNLTSACTDWAPQT